jgi:hypothetical protein
LLDRVGSTGADSEAIPDVPHRDSTPR